MSQSAAIFCASSSAFFFSPLLTRQFSSSTTWPGATFTPFSTQFATSGTSRPSSSARRLATGASESSGLNSPSVGRPRCEVTITAAPASSAAWMAGTDARTRVSSVMLPWSSCGTFRSARMKTRWPETLPSAIRSVRRLTWLMGLIEVVDEEGVAEKSRAGCRRQAPDGRAGPCDTLEISGKGHSSRSIPRPAPPRGEFRLFGTEAFRCCRAASKGFAAKGQMIRRSAVDTSMPTTIVPIMLRRHRNQARPAAAA